MPKAKQQGTVEARGAAAAEATGSDAPGRKRASSAGPAKTELAPLKAGHAFSANTSNGAVAKPANGAAKKGAAAGGAGKETTAKEPAAKAPTAKAAAKASTAKAPAGKAPGGEKAPAAEKAGGKAAAPAKAAKPAAKAAKPVPAKAPAAKTGASAKTAAAKAEPAAKHEAPAAKHDEPVAKAAKPAGKTVTHDKAEKAENRVQAATTEPAPTPAPAASATPATAGPAPAKAKPVPVAKAQPVPVAKAQPAPVAPEDDVPQELFYQHQRGLLMAERHNYTRQAEELRAQAAALALEHEPGDVQFDEEGGEGGTANVDRELDLHLSAQAQAAIEEIDAALAKIEDGTYGTCESCGNPVPKARLEAIPHARLCVTCKSGGLSARRQ